MPATRLQLAALLALVVVDGILVCVVGALWGAP